MNNDRQKVSTVVSWGACVMLLLPLWSYASNVAQVTVKVTIVAPPPCTINNNQPIEVNFGDVMTTRIDGLNYRKPVDYSLDCPQDQLLKNALKLQIQGTGINLGGATSVLEVPGVPDFGIQLQHETSALNVNEWLNFDYPNVPNLYAVPVMKSGASLNAGAFSASSTMKVEYQ